MLLTSGGLFGVGGLDKVALRIGDIGEDM